MDQLIFASLSHTHYWYEVGMLKVPAYRIFLCTNDLIVLHYSLGVFIFYLFLSEEIPFVYPFTGIEH